MKSLYDIQEETAILKAIHENQAARLALRIDYCIDPDTALGVKQQLPPDEPVACNKPSVTDPEQRLQRIISLIDCFGDSPLYPGVTEEARKRWWAVFEEARNIAKGAA